MASLEFDLDRDALPDEPTPNPPPPPDATVEGVSSSSSSSLPLPPQQQQSPTSAAAPEAEEEDFHDVVDEEEEIRRRVREATEWKAKGNEHYKRQDFEGALECYGTALEVCPGESERIPKAVDALAGTTPSSAGPGEAGSNEGSETADTTDGASKEVGHDQEGKEGGDAGEAQRPSDGASASAGGGGGGEDEFEPMSEEMARHAEQRSVLHCNRAACLQQLGRHDDAVDECSWALGLSPAYLKALLRRAQAYEALERYGDAIRDLGAVLELDPTSKLAKERKAKLEEAEAARMEKLKEETLGKLKDLGNSILGNFGLSTDNFKFDKDESTGSYNIQFVQKP